MRNKIKRIGLLLIFFLTLFCNNTVFGQNDVEIYRIVKDANELAENDKLIIVNREHQMIMGSQKTDNRDAVEMEMSGDIIYRNSNVGESFVLKGEKDKWGFLTKDNKYLCSSTKNGENRLLTEDKLDGFGKAKITIDISCNAVIKFQGSTVKNYKGNMRYNDTYKLFNCYGETNDQKPVQIFKKVSNQSIITISGNEENDNNTNAIKDAYAEGTPKNIEIKRSFIGDGGWYTLCLPFALNEDDIKTTFKGTKFYEFSSVETNDNGAMLLNFKEVKETTSGTPYLIQPLKDTEITNPWFENKVINVNQPTSIVHSLSDGSNACKFVGVFDPTPIEGRNIRFVGANGSSLVTPNGDNSKLKALRAYIILPDDVKVAKINSSGNTSAIHSVDANKKSGSTRIYNLNGEYIGDSEANLPSGIYIVNHKKVVK